MKFSAYIFQVMVVILIIGVATSQPLIREKRRIRDALKKIGDSAFSSFGAAAGSTLGGRVGNIKIPRRG